MRYTIGIGTYFGIPLKVHATFPLMVLVYAAVAWREGTGADALHTALLVLGLFVCVVLHELGHCLQARRYGVRFAINTDSHSTVHLAHLRYGVGTAQRGWVAAEEVINTWPLSKLRQFVTSKRKGRHS